MQRMHSALSRLYQHYGETIHFGLASGESIDAKALIERVNIEPKLDRVDVDRDFLTCRLLKVSVDFTITPKQDRAVVDGIAYYVDKIDNFNRWEYHLRLLLLPE